MVISRLELMGAGSRRERGGGKDIRGRRYEVAIDGVGLTIEEEKMRNGSIGRT